MQFRIKVLKSISFLFVCLVTLTSQAQKVKIDGVGVVVGKNIVLDSDIEKFKLELKNSSEGKITISDCEMLEQLMLQKLLAHHAVEDSVVVADVEVNAQVQRNIQYFSQQYGSVDKMVNAYGFNDEEDLRKEMFKIEKENFLVRREQAKITEKVDVTPEEVRIYYNGLKKLGELPEFPAEIQLAQLVMNVEPTKEEEKRVIDKLNEIKKEIEEGSSFRMKAIINSEDPAVVNNGGKYDINKNSSFIQEFIETAFNLEVGQISEPFKSDFGYHIMKLEEVKGENRVASHILMRPVVPEYKLLEAKTKLEQVKKDIEEGKMTFDEAVTKYSDLDTKKASGLLINELTGESTFDLTKMDPALYARVNELKKGELTDVFYDETQTGEKMYKVIIMKERVDTHKADLVNDYVKVRNLALTKKKQEVIEKWSKEKINDTYIKMTPEYQKCKFDNNWKKEVK